MPFRIRTKNVLQFTWRQRTADSAKEKLKGKFLKNIKHGLFTRGRVAASLNSYRWLNRRQLENNVFLFWLCYKRNGKRCSCRRCASRDSTNQNASFVDWFSGSERAVFRGICGEIFALFQACVGNFDTIPPWEVVGTLYLDSSCVTF